MAAGDQDRPTGEDSTVPASDEQMEGGSRGGRDRTPTDQHLHDAVKAALFEGGPLPREYEAGTVLGGRYRVIGLLGKGGMGEVYRARDLVIDEDVAIKFLPPGLDERPAYLERFVQEVRVARQVSHPNVCRVHDMGEIEGRRFISMEYIDGEDLASLLRRIGRLGPEKAIELAHQLCAGIAALHERGIVHRDLKPSNIMLDGQGRIRIADFGLASVAAELTEHQYRDGTPAYQAPEQAEGREVTPRSDIYSLGMILWEMFVGERYQPGETIEVDADRTASRVDPAVLSVLEQCLHPDPSHRPASPLSVAAALPGGDPLAAALAAGRLPSPEAVANTAEVGALRPVVAYLLCALVAVASIVLVSTHHQVSALAHAGELESPPILEKRVEEILEVAAVPTPFSVDARWIELDPGVIDHANEQDDPGEALDKSELSPVRMRFHGYPRVQTLGITDLRYRPLSNPLDTLVVVDGRGRLRELQQTPPDPEPASTATGGETPAPPASPQTPGDRPPRPSVEHYDWSPLILEAGLDPAMLVPSDRRIVPAVYADETRAWTTSIDDAPVRVSAASLAGHPVWFRVELDSPDPDDDTDEADGEDEDEDGLHTTAFGVLAFILAVVILAVIPAVVGPALAALVRKKGDFTGARRLAIGWFVLETVGWGLGVRGPELVEFIPRATLGLGMAVLVWLFYLMVEPWVRQHWPHALVSWTRVLQGRWRDPMVGRDVLIGLTVGGVLLAGVGGLRVALLDDLSQEGTLDVFLGTRFVLSGLAQTLQGSIWLALIILVFLLGLQRIFRRRRLAIAILCSVMPSVALLVWLEGGQTEALVELLSLSAVVIVVSTVMSRFGLLSLVSFLFFAVLLRQFPMPLFVDDSLGEAGWWTLATLAVVAAAGYWTSTAPLRRRTATSGASGARTAV